MPKYGGTICGPMQLKCIVIIAIVAVVGAGPSTSHVSGASHLGASVDTIKRSQLKVPVGMDRMSLAATPPIVIENVNLRGAHSHRVTKQSHKPKLLASATHNDQQISSPIILLLFMALGFLRLLVWGWPKVPGAWVVASNSASNETATEGLIQFYDFCSNKYADLLDQVEWSIPIWISENAHFLPARGRVLDLGCADGTVGDLVNCFQENISLVGIDVSPKMAEQCAESPFYEEVHVQDLSLGLPTEVFMPNAFDAVTAFGCLEFIPNHNSLMAQVAEVLRPQGVLAASFELYSDQGDIVMWGRRKTLHTVDSVHALLEGCGFEVIQTTIEDTAYYYEGIPIPYVLVVARNPYPPPPPPMLE